jgi:phosphoketolase
VVFAVTGDMALLPVFEAKDRLEAAGRKVRIVSAANPRRLYRPTDVAWDTVSEPDNTFMDDDHFNALFDGDVLIGVSGGPSGPLEPIMLRTRAAQRDVLAWKRGETTASPARSWPSTAHRRSMAARVEGPAGLIRVPPLENPGTGGIRVHPRGMSQPPPKGGSELP